jgi:RNA polymerase sigma-70 factor (ECF subfamily)
VKDVPISDFDADLCECLPRLRRFAHALSRDRADADDLAQATVERALRSKAKWLPGTRLDSWLFRIMRNLWIDKVRSRVRRRRHEAPSEDGVVCSFDPRPAIQASIDLNTAMKAMERLPAEQREVVSLILIEGLGYREASELLDLPIGTVASRLTRGRMALLAMLGD